MLLSHSLQDGLEKKKARTTVTIYMSEELWRFMYRSTAFDAKLGKDGEGNRDKKEFDAVLSCDGMIEA